MLTQEHHEWVRQTFGVDPEAAEPPPAGEGASLPAPMQPDCVVVHGKVPGPKHHVLCATHGHILDDQKKLIIAPTLADYERTHPTKLPAPMQPDCMVIRGKVPGPKHHVLCGMHGHVLDEEKKQIIAHSVAEYRRHHPWPPAAGHAEPAAAGHAAPAAQKAAPSPAASPPAAAPTAPAPATKDPASPVPATASPAVVAPATSGPPTAGPTANNPSHPAKAPPAAKEPETYVPEKLELLKVLRYAVDSLTELKDAIEHYLKVDFGATEGCRVSGAAVMAAGATTVVSLTTALGALAVDIASVGTASAVAGAVGLPAAMLCMTSMAALGFAVQSFDSCKEEWRTTSQWTPPEEAARRQAEAKAVQDAWKRVSFAQNSVSYALRDLKEWVSQKD